MSFPMMAPQKWRGGEVSWTNIIAQEKKRERRGPRRSSATNTRAQSCPADTLAGKKGKRQRGRNPLPGPGARSTRAVMRERSGIAFSKAIFITLECQESLSLIELRSWTRSSSSPSPLLLLLSSFSSFHLFLTPPPPSLDCPSLIFLPLPFLLHANRRS